MGRLVRLTRPTTLRAILAAWCAYTKIPTVRLALAPAKDLDSPINSIAVCVGSGKPLTAPLACELACHSAGLTRTH